MPKGFSLIEVCIVIALFSIVVTLTLPYFSLSDSLTVRSELEMLRACILTMQAQARLEHKQIALMFYPNEHSYEASIYKHTLAPSVSFSFDQKNGPPSTPSITMEKASTFKDNTIVFYPNGIISSGTVYLQNKKKTCLYALTCSVAAVLHVRTYKYCQGIWYILD